MQLDAPAFKPVLTPEVALSIVTRAVKGKHWPKYDVSQIKLAYTPFWVFSFDVLSEGAASPGGKAAINAYSGELSDFVPLLFDRPLEKLREINDGEGEVEETTISRAEIANVAASKLAAQTGAKKDQITISAITKIYAPFFRIWVDVADDTFRVDIDGALGAPFGLEAIPQRAKDWNEITTETVTKMKTPEGWMDLAGKAMTIGSGGGKAAGGILGNSTSRIAILLIVVVVLAFVALRPAGLGGGVDSSCYINDAYVTRESGFLGMGTAKVTLFPACIGCPGGQIKPASNYSVDGVCSYVNRAGKEVRTVTTIALTVDGKRTSNIVTLLSEPNAGGFVLNKSWTLTWPATTGDPATTSYGVEYQHLT